MCRAEKEGQERGCSYPVYRDHRSRKVEGMVRKVSLSEKNCR